ncbi:outer membrane protein, multidrug efflux system [Massilia sp. PDC64]|nr:efflux transporter outer membrane subunit [Massilia sp. PDC64]SDC29167.1 outer membrane protein, multidrug efflux system [Massilia sp. PDC64]
MIRLAPLAAALLLSGCALAPAYHRPDAPVAPTFPGGPAQAGGPVAADIGWRDFLRDARLQRLVDLALRENRDLRVAMLNVEKVRATYRVQQAALLPRVDVDAARNTGNRTTGPRFTTGFTASWEPDFFGRLHSLSDAALQQYLASEEASRAARILLVGEVADQYLALRGAEVQLDVTRQALATAQASLRIVDLQYRGGIASELDLRQARTAVELAQANEQAGLRARAQAENALVLLVGAPLPADLPPPAPFDTNALLTDIPAGLPSALLERRPDILQAEHVLRAETADIGAARAAFFPDISLTASAGVASGSLAHLFGSGGVWTFVPSLLAPIFDGGANRANLDAATVQRDIGVAQYQKAIQTAFREVADGLAARGTYAGQLAALQGDVADQQRRLELAQKRYADGIDDYLAVLSAQTDLYDARSTLVAAQLGQLTSLVDLYRALGGGWTDHTIVPNGPV